MWVFKQFSQTVSSVGSEAILRVCLPVSEGSNYVTYVDQSISGSVIVCCQVWRVEVERLMKTSVCVSEGSEAPVWLTGSAKLLYSFQPSSGCDSHTKQLDSVLPHNRFPSLPWELCERTGWRRKMRFEPSPLSLSISLQALAVRLERKHFGVFQSDLVYCRPFRGMVNVRGSGYNQFIYCRVWNRPPWTRQLTLKLVFFEAEALWGFSGHTGSWCYSRAVIWYYCCTFRTVIISSWWLYRSCTKCQIWMIQSYLKTNEASFSFEHVTLYCFYLFRTSLKCPF